MKKKIICIVGRTNTGKDTLAKKVAEAYRIPIICSFTDRPMRKGETNGVQHYFLSEKEFSDLIRNNDLLAYTEISDPNVPGKGYRYCTTKKQIDNLDEIGCIYIIDPKGLGFLKEKFGNEYEFHTINIQAAEKIRRQRSAARGDTNFEDRIANENKQFDEFEKKRKADYIVDNNGEIERAYVCLSSIIKNILAADNNESLPSLYPMTFLCAETMLNIIVEDCIDLYSPSLETYVFLYNDQEAIAYYPNIDLQEAIQLAKKAGTGEDSEYWGAFLGIGGYILDSKEECLEFCKERFATGDWYDTRDISEMVAKLKNADETIFS